MNTTKMALAMVMSSLLLLQGCGGDSGGGNTANTSPTITGTAAYGAPMAQASVTLLDAQGTQRTATAGDDGSYTIDATGLKAPFLITASMVSGDTTLTYSAIGTTVPTQGAVATVNLTPLTTAIVTLASSTGSDPTQFQSASALQALDTSRLSKAEDTVKTIIAEVAKDAGLGTNFNPVTTPFAANLTSGGDKILETIKVTVSDSGVTLTNALAPVASGADAASATVTIKNVATDTATVLPKPTVQVTFNELLAKLRSQLNTCLALAPADRVTLDSNNKPTALKGACSTSSMSAFDTTYLSGGYDLLGRWGPRLRDIPKGASMAQAEILASFARADGSNSISFRLPISAENGGLSYSDTLVSDTTGSNWKISGNQRKYDLGVSARLFKYIDVSSYERTGNSNGPDASKSVGRMSRYESGLNFSFDPSGPNAEKVYAVRIKGPALPDAGLVLARSETCGTGDYLAIYSSDGTLPDATGKTAAFTATASNTNTWRYAATPLDNTYTGTDFWNELRGYASAGVIASSAPATSPNTPNSRRVTPIDPTSIPELAKYSFEVYSVGSASPETFSMSLTDKPQGTDAGKIHPWSSPTAATLKYLDPATSNPLSAALTSATLAWTVPAGAPLVNGVTLSGSGRNGSNETDRFSLGSNVSPLGAKSMQVGFSAETDGAGKLCTASKTAALSATNGSRDVALRQRAGRTTFSLDYYHDGRSAAAAPATITGGDGWSYYNANALPLEAGSVVLADGTRSEFSFTYGGSNPVITLSDSNTPAGQFSLDTYVSGLAGVSAQGGYRIRNVALNSGAYPRTFAVIAKVTGNSLGNSGVQTMYLDMGLADKGVSGPRLQFNIREGGTTGSKVTLANVITKNSTATTPGTLSSTAIDTSGTHIYQFIVTLSSATEVKVEVFVDKVSTPIMSETLTRYDTVSTLGDNYLRFGDLSSTTAFKSTLDYLAWTTSAASYYNQTTVPAGW